jgi:hypothetical protein
MLLAACSTMMAQECTRTLPMTVVNRLTGLPFGPFKTNQLHARAGHRSLPILSVGKLTAGRVLVLVDDSGSMGYASTLMKHLGPTLVRDNPTGSQLAFGFFHGQIVISPRFTTDDHEVDKVIEQHDLVRTPLGGTRLFDAIHEGLQLFGQARFGDTMLVITDGIDSTSKIRKDTLESELKVSGVRVFSIALSEYEGHQDERDWLAKIANTSGGAVYTIYTAGANFADAEWRKRTYDALLVLWEETVLRGLTITVRAPAETKKVQWRLEIGGYAVVHYPPFLTPCPE